MSWKLNRPSCGQKVSILISRQVTCPGKNDIEILPADSNANMHHGNNLSKNIRNPLKSNFIDTFWEANQNTQEKACLCVCVWGVGRSQTSLCTFEFPLKHQQRSSWWLTEQLIHAEGSSSKQLQRNTSQATFHHRHKNRQPKTLCEEITPGSL